VWESQDGHPGAILAMQSANIQFPPQCLDFGPPYEIQITADVGEEFFVGLSQCSGDDIMPVGADMDGPATGDQSWFNVPPWPGYDPGWHRINALWSDSLHALGIGVYLEPPPVPADPVTWGTIKELFRK
jgi:hypothetical protein